MEPLTRKEMLLDEKWISTPDMGEYLDSTMIMKAAEELSNGELGGEFFIEKPFATAPGYYPTENVVILSGKPTFLTDKDEIANTGRNRTDGDTVYLDFDEIIDGGVDGVFNTTDQPMSPKELLRHAYESGVVEKASMLGVRFLGLNAPELPHFRDFKYEIGKDVSTYKPVFTTYKELINTKEGDMVETSIGPIKKSNFAYVKYNPMTPDPTPRKEEEVLIFIGEMNEEENEDTGKHEMKYLEVLEAPLINNDGSKEFEPKGTMRICASHGAEDGTDVEQFRQALAAQQDVMRLIKESSNVIYMLDQSYLVNKAKGRIPFSYRKEFEKISGSPFYAFESLYKNLTKAGESAYQQVGKKYFGQEANGRYLGACYVEQTTGNSKQWVNVAKYLISRYPSMKVLPTYSNSEAANSEYSNIADAFKLWSYDQSKQVFLDKLNDMGKDDRSDIQRQLTGVDLSELTEHTVMIGDCLLMIPPTSIRTVTQTRSERMSLLRSRGTLTKTLPKTERIIEMQLYFNGADAINGIKYEQETPSGTTMTYHMNGLRSLVSQFKFTPFLPIHNNYINYVLNVEAVSLVSIQVTTVPNYPKTLQATIKLQEFDYRQYMPEILPPDAENKEDLYTNLFSKVIHWPVFRYYYQRAIQSGEEISDMKFDSEPYSYATIGQKTTLQNMKFMIPTFELYLANEEMLKQRKTVKQSLEKNPIESVIKFNKKEEEFLRNLSNIYTAIRKAMTNCDKDIDGLFIPEPLENGEETFVLYNRKADFSSEIKVYEDTVDYNKRGTTFGIYHGLKYVPGGISLPIGPKYIEHSATVPTEKLYPKYMKNIVTELMKAISTKKEEASVLKDARFVYKQSGNEETWNKKDGFQTKYEFGLELDIDWAKDGYKETLDKVRRLIAKSNSLLVEDIFKDGKIFIGWESIFKLEPKSSTDTDLLLESKGRINTYSTPYIVMNSLANSFGISLDKENKDTEDMWSGTEDIGDMKDNIDLETSKSIKYDYYDIGTPIINSISFAYNNIFNKMSMKIYDGYASQFTGGTDTTIDINMTATNEYTVNKLQAISRICAQRLIDFRKILASSPLRINSEMTRFMGVNEVIIESVDVSTIPNSPGTWTINMRLMSVDRTLRNREAMKKIDEITNVTTDMDPLVKTKNFFDVKNTLAKVELYPDLELPTVSELEKLGFYFIKYRSDSARMFPDADFYFSYLHVFSSEMLRETIVNFFKDSKNHSLYQEYAGNLFKDDKALVKWNVNSKEPKNITDEEKENLAGEYPEKSAQASSLSEALMATNSKKEGDRLNKLIKDATGSTAEEPSGVSQKTKELVDKANQVKSAIFGLREAMDCTNFDSYDFNSVHKVSVKGTIPYNQEKQMLSGEREVRVYLGDGKYEKKKVPDKVKASIESLKAIILEILSKPIATKNLKKPSNNSDYDELFDYLAIDILGAKSINDLNYRLKVKSSKDMPINAKDNLTAILEGCARGATAKLGIFDVDAKKGSEAKHLDAVSRDMIKDNPNVLVPVEGQGLSTYALADTDEERENGIVFGNFAIKKYSPSMLANIFGVTLINAKDGFLDPYYNSQLSSLILGTTDDIDIDERTEAYRKGLMKGPSGHCDDGLYSKDKLANTYSHNAFFRIMLVWLYKLMTDERQSLLPDTFFLMAEMNTLLETAKEVDDAWYENISFFKMKTNIGSLANKVSKKDMDSSPFTAEEKAVMDEDAIQKQAIEEETIAEKEIEKMRKDIEEGMPRLRLSLLNGLFLSLGAIALTEFNSPIYTAIKGGDLATYSSYIEKIKGTALSGQTLSDTDMQIRRMFQYIDFQINAAQSYEKMSEPAITDKYSFQGKTQRLYLEAAENPSVYLMHSFYDMVTNDMRGRMARAFPTYYMLLIDEGRDLGVWRLQDNFYDVSAITEFQVVKSRKIAADTAKIVMTNLFGTFTTEDDDMKDEYQYTMRDMFNSVFSPKVYVEKEFQRYTEARDINRAKLKPGARVNLRMGYSADASKLPIMFNGSIAEIQEGDLMTLVCQGDGIELANPAMFNSSDAKDVADLKYNDSFISGFLGIFEDITTPRDLMLNPLIAEGTWAHEVIKDWSKGRLFNANPFGIVHFGDKHFKEVFSKNGEPEQNIYEALSRPSWGRDVPMDSNDYSYSLTSAPKIKVGLQGNRSYWDLMHIAASVSPDFIASIVPFQMRSSIFYGAPRYYYAYDYDKLPNGQLVEKRKPFQQYHIYTSYTDILNNGIYSKQ